MDRRPPDNSDETETVMPMWIPAKRSLVFLFLFAALAPVLAGQKTATGNRPPRPERILLTWSGDPATTQAVTWRTAGPVTRAQGVLTRAGGDPRPFRIPAALHRVAAVTTRITPPKKKTSVYYHTAHFTGLEPATVYAYRVGTTGAWSEWNQFTTAPREPERFSFLYLGDAQNELDSMWPRVIRTAFRRAPRARFILYAGDLVNLGRRDRDWGKWFAAGGWIHRVMPCVATPGNHEYYRFSDSKDQTPSLTPLWSPQFKYPLNGAPDLENTCYALDYPGLRLVVLNSNERIQEQAAWLDRTLTRPGAPWTIASFHHPVYSTAEGRDNPEIRKAWQPVFEKHGVHLVLQGHDHAYGRRSGPGRPAAGRTVRSRRADTVYIVSVSGPKMYAVGSSAIRTMQRVGENIQLFQVITVEKSRLDYECFDAAGRLFDAFSLERKPGQAVRLVERRGAEDETSRPREKTKG